MNYGGGPAACMVIAQHFSRFLIGEDPFNIEKLWDQMYRSSLPYGLGGVTAMAMSGVDLALWDLLGRALKQPVFRLLGGQTKESIPCYVTTHPDLVGAWRNSGFLGVKVAAPWGIANGREGLKKMQLRLEKCRAEIGDEMELMVDCYLSWISNSLRGLMSACGHSISNGLKTRWKTARRSISITICGLGSRPYRWLLATSSSIIKRLRQSLRQGRVM